MTARNPQAAQANPQMQIMQRVFPLISGLISFSLPGGVVLYFFVSNLFRIAQQSLMYRLDPALSAEVKKEVKEIDAKATEIEHEHEKGGGRRTAPTAGNGSRANGNRQQQNRPNSRRSKKRRSKKR